jgi:dephospho-CoA kinase
VKRIVIAGGIGAGKSAATDYLASLGFPVIDADDVARAVTEPGQPAWRAMRDAFGDAVLRDDRSLDRAFVAEVVFHDPSALRRLNLITHGHIGEEILRQVGRVTGSAVFISIPLFRPEHRAAFNLDEVWAILASPEVALARLVEQRHFSEEDARARLASQITNEERFSLVDHVLWNDGTIEELYLELDAQLTRSGLVHG